MRLAPGRAPQRKFAESRRAWDAPGGSGNWEEAGDVHTGSPGPAPRDNSGLEGGGGERGARPGPACEHWWCHRRDWLAFQAWRPSSVLATPPSAARSAGVPERPAGWGSAAAQRCVLWTPPLPKARGPDPAPCPERAKKPSAAAPAAARLCINVGRQPDQRRGLEGRGQG